ncbi:MAG: hypothetical protein AAF530_25380 [Pseudomonadota bacterium]
MLLKTSTMALAATLAIFSASAAAKAGDRGLDVDTWHGGYSDQKVKIRSTDVTDDGTLLNQNGGVAIHMGEANIGAADVNIKSRSLGYVRQEIDIASTDIEGGGAVINQNGGTVVSLP